MAGELTQFYFGVHKSLATIRPGKIKKYIYIAIKERLGHVLKKEGVDVVSEAFGFNIEKRMAKRT